MLSMGDTLICVASVDGREPSRALRRKLEAADVRLLFDRRAAERRAERDRREREGEGLADDRRRIRCASGRRVGERRALLEPVVAADLPDELASHAGDGGILLVRRIAPTRQEIEDLEDLRLIVRLQSGDQSAFDPVYERHLRRIHSYANAALTDPIDAEDVAQEVFLKMLEAMPVYEVTGAPFRVWLFRVLRNLVTDRLRDRQRILVEPPELIDERIEEAGIASGDGRSIADQLFERSSELSVLNAVEGLTDAQRQVLVLRFLLGLDTVEIARMLETTPNAVANRQYRAVDALKAHFATTRGEVAAGRPRLAMQARPRLSPVLQVRLLLPF